MAKFKDLTGQKFGRLTVLSRAENSKDGSTRWNCECDCEKHTQIVVDSRNLKTGHTKSCGCLTDKSRHNKLIDLTGQWFGFLEVIERVPKPDHVKSDRTYYKCICHCCYCGNKEIIVTSARLRNGQSTSCGCSELRAKRMSETMKKYNEYDMESSKYGIGYTSNGVKFYFDKEDFDKIKDYCWHIAADNSVTAYALGKQSTKIVYFHRLVMGVTNNKIQVDHNNHDRHDNRKGNLTVVTNSQNGMNKWVSSKNTSGHPGVTFAKDRNKWRAYITVNKKTINLGSFEKYDDAVKARKEAEEKYFGQYSYDNCINRLPRIED